MAPYLNVATFNNGWDGADHHNEGRRLLNKSFLEELQRKTGAIPWFVNAGSGRFPFGFFFWKMSKYGVRGKVEWYYNLRNEAGSLVRTQATRLPDARLRALPGRHRRPEVPLHARAAGGRAEGGGKGPCGSPAGRRPCSRSSPRGSRMTGRPTPAGASDSRPTGSTSWTPRRPRRWGTSTRCAGRWPTALWRSRQRSNRASRDGPVGTAGGTGQGPHPVAHAGHHP